MLRYAKVQNMQEYNIENYIKGAKRIAMGGHIRPDGDCVGSCIGLYTYLKNNYSELTIDLYLQPIPEKLHFLRHTDEIKSEYVQREPYDLFILLDSSDKDRLGEFLPYFEQAERTLCIDHHKSNTNFADDNIVVPDASSCCEVLYTMFNEEKIDYDVACALYLGIVHDSGVFKYSNTSALTMSIAGKLMEKGIPFTDIIDNTFYSKTYVQNQILGRALLESVMFFDGKCVFSVVSRKEMDFYNITYKDLDGIVEQLRLTEGVEVAIFTYHLARKNYKYSLRAKSFVDVSKIASSFGGGGHVMAAGFESSEKYESVLAKIIAMVEEQMNAK